MPRPLIFFLFLKTLVLNLTILFIAGLFLPLEKSTLPSVKIKKLSWPNYVRLKWDLSNLSEFDRKLPVMVQLGLRVCHVAKISFWR